MGIGEAGGWYIMGILSVWRREGEGRDCDYPLLPTTSAQRNSHTGDQLTQTWPHPPSRVDQSLSLLDTTSSQPPRLTPNWGQWHKQGCLHAQTCHWKLAFGAFEEYMVWMSIAYVVRGYRHDFIREICCEEWFISVCCSMLISVMLFSFQFHCFVNLQRDFGK